MIMYQPKKGFNKQIKSKSSRTLSAPKVFKPLPERGVVTIGEIKGSYPYADNIKEIVSLEFARNPIDSKQKTKKRVLIISGILKKTGFRLLNEIGDEIRGRH